MPAERLQGRVRSFRGNWGFLQCDEIDGDIFVGLKGNPHLSGLSEGETVEFELTHDSRGKKEAVNVEVAGKGPARPVRRSPRRRIPAGKPAARELQEGFRGSGRVRSFTGQWGFINSDDFTGDLFVGLRSNPHLSELMQGDEVDFEVQVADGKVEAVDVLVTAPADGNMEVERPPPKPKPASAGRTAPKPPGGGNRAEVSHLVGHMLIGTIRSFKDPWGFVNSENFDGDLFLHVRSNPDLGPVTAGDPVEFEVAEDGKDGTFHAVNSVMMMDDLANLLGQRMSGWVKSFKGQWGLLNSRRFDGELFVGLASNPQISQLSPGEGVDFEVASSEKGKTGFQAIGVSKTGEIVPVEQTRAPATRPQPGQRQPGQRQPGRPLPDPEALLGQICTGAVKSFRDGWGFVNSDAFAGDLFVHSGSNPGLPKLQPGDIVEFEVTESAKGKLHATSVQVVPQEQENLVGALCMGTVRKFSGEWGFITSPKFLGDLFLGLRNNPQMREMPRQGDEVEFVIERSSAKSGKGYEAVNAVLLNVSAPPPAPAPRPPSRRERSRSPRRNAGRQRGGGDPSEMVGSTVSGQVRSFRGDWGFVTSNSFSGDLFIGSRSNSHLTQLLKEGDNVSFTIAVGSSGKAEAVEVDLL